MERDDVSRFLVHLTRSGGNSHAADNLISILEDQTLEARNFHCLCMYKIEKLGLEEELADRFKSVCLTETPLTQIRHIAQKIEGRQIELSPYGLVFRRKDLLERGATPAVYLNGKKGGVGRLLNDRFYHDFRDARTLAKAITKHGANFDAVVNHYATLNTIRSGHDFTWEREWRFVGDLPVDFSEVYVILAKDPKAFRKRCEHELPAKVAKSVAKIPIISPAWSYETLVHHHAVNMWNN